MLKSEWQDDLAPGHSREEHACLRLGLIRADQLADRYGTPLLVLNLDVVDAAVESIYNALNADHLDISYASKAFICVAFARYLVRLQISIDVCSLGELLTAERAGLDPKLLTFHGVGKTDDELRAVVEGRVGCIVVDGVDELRRLASLLNGTRIDVLLRLNTEIKARTHTLVRTSGDNTKFGIHRDDEKAAFTILEDNNRLHFAGLHAHIGSRIYDSQTFEANAIALIDAAARIVEGGWTVESVVVGGGFGVQTHPHYPPKSVALGEIIRAIEFCVKSCAQSHSIPMPRIGIEPGRAIVARAGTTLYRVQAIMRQGSRTFVVVDGGMTDNPRPALYGANHYVVTANQGIDDEQEVTVCDGRAKTMS